MSNMPNYKRQFAGLISNPHASPKPDVSDWKFMGYPNNGTAVFQINANEEAYIKRPELERVSEQALELFREHKESDDLIMISYSVRSRGSDAYSREHILCCGMSVMTMLNGLNGLSIPQYNDEPGIW